jgi:two-component system, OmpR family, sensor histidine kinase KdpD
VNDVMRGSVTTRGAHRREVIGSAVTLGGLIVLMAVLLPVRAHVGVATPALLFLVPVTFGVVIGGAVPGVLGAVAGFVIYDLFFIPPYGNLSVHSPQNWVALLVYVIVVFVVAQVVGKLQSARDEAQRRVEESARLFELSQALIGDLTLAQLLAHIADTVQGVFTPRWTALVLPVDGTDGGGGELVVAARAGQELTAADGRSLTMGGGQTRSLGLIGGDAPARVEVALVVSNRPVGMLVLQDVQFVRQDRSLLGTFANQAALAIDRAQLREQALRARLLEEVDRWRGALMGAVSHDLRTPLASVKTAVSSLRQSGKGLGPQDRAELLELIEVQADRLARLVTNLLDMTRIESGALELRPMVMSFEELVDEAMASLGGLAPAGRVQVSAPDDLPLLRIDHILIGQVLANVLENAGRISPPASVIRVSARAADGASAPLVEISVSDEGPGIDEEERERVFEMFSQNGGGGRAGLGLAISKSFVEAHGGTIWVDTEVEQGARVVFSVPSEAQVPVDA